MAHSVASELRVARLTVDQVQAMLEAGILKDGDPIELVDGVLVYKDRSAQGEDPMTIGRRHNLVVKLLAQIDPRLAALGCHVQTQGPWCCLRSASWSLTPSFFAASPGTTPIGCPARPMRQL